jgi:hypothetical protein
VHAHVFRAELGFLNNLWGLGTKGNKVVVPARQAIQSGGIDSLESILGLLKSLKVRAVLQILLCRDGGFHVKETPRRRITVTSS